MQIEINRQRTGNLNSELVVQMVDLLSRVQPNRCAKMTHRVLHQSQKERSAIYASIYFGSIFEQKVQRYVLVLQKRHAPFAGEEVEERVASETRELLEGTALAGQEADRVLEALKPSLLTELVERLSSLEIVADKKFPADLGLRLRT